MDEFEVEHHLTEEILYVEEVSNVFSRRECPKGVCREGSGYVASIRLNKKQQKGPVRTTISEAVRDRAQMLFMKNTRGCAQVELWINSLKRKKRKHGIAAIKAQSSSELDVLDRHRGQLRSNYGIDVFTLPPPDVEDEQRRLAEMWNQYLVSSDSKCVVIGRDISKELDEIDRLIMDSCGRQTDILKEMMGVQAELFQ